MCSFEIHHVCVAQKMSKWEGAKMAILANSAYLPIAYFLSYTNMITLKEHTFIVEKRFKK